MIYESLIASVVEDKLKELKRVKDIQCSDGNWDYDPYMHGMANGIILSESIITEEDPKFLEAPEWWLDAKANS